MRDAVADSARCDECHVLAPRHNPDCSLIPPMPPPRYPVEIRRSRPRCQRLFRRHSWTVWTTPLDLFGPGPLALRWDTRQCRRCQDCGFIDSRPV